MGRQENNEARRKAILDAALAEFSSKGFVCARVEDIARMAGVAKGTIYLYFKDKEALFNGLLEAGLAPARERAGNIWADGSLSLRDKLLRIYEPLFRAGEGSRRLQIMRLACAEGLRNPGLVAPYYRNLLAPLLDLHRENLRHLPEQQAPPPAWLEFPFLLAAPLIHGIMWQQMFGSEAELDLEAMYRAYLDMILPEKNRTD